MKNKKVRFGTVDCTEYGGVCQSLGIQQYPSVLYFNGSDATVCAFNQ
jgi:thioredoxin-like negative regulator of GroEL